MFSTLAPRPNNAASTTLLSDVSRLTSIIAAQQEISEAQLQPELVMEIVADRARQLTNADGAIVEIADSGDMVYRAAAGEGLQHLGLRIPTAASLSGLCVRTGQVMTCGDTETDPRVDLETCRRVKVRSMVVVPLYHDRECLGVLKVFYYQPHGFLAEDVSTLQLLAGMIGTALGHASEQKLRNELLTELEAANKLLEQLATTDSLTRLKNRRCFDEELKCALAAQRRKSIPLSLIMIDVDQFKSFNDTFGHPAGDDVLRTAAAILRQAVRAHETVARFGGEEFAAILPNTTAAEAMLLAERLREAVAGFVWPKRPVTISLGVASTDRCEPDKPSLLSLADKALYQSKQQGRDRITFMVDAD